MCQYRPYVHICDHGTEDEPSNHLVDACDNPPAFPGILCNAPKFIHWPLETGIPCWQCHQQSMEELAMKANIWKYMMIIDQLGSLEIKDMIPELRQYNALMIAVHAYAAGGLLRTPMKIKITEGDAMDSPSYWTNGIHDLLKLVDMPGEAGRLIASRTVKEGSDTAQNRRAPRRVYDRQPVVSRDGYRYDGEGGVSVEMTESASDDEGVWPYGQPPGCRP